MTEYLALFDLRRALPQGSAWLIALLLQARFLRFLAVGVANTAFGYGLFLLAFEISGRPFLALVLSTLAGVAFNFFSIGAVVFRSTDRRRVWRFVAVYGVVFAVNAAMLRALEVCGVSPALAQALLVPCLAVLSYVLNRNYVFVDGKSSTNGASLRAELE